jgi:hypothetical protein
MSLFVPLHTFDRPDTRLQERQKANQTKMMQQQVNQLSSTACNLLNIFVIQEKLTKLQSAILAKQQQQQQKQ